MKEMYHFYVHNLVSYGYGYYITSLFRCIFVSLDVFKVRAFGLITKVKAAELLFSKVAKSLTLYYLL